MKVKWLGHATFLVTSDAGVKIITDPYITGAFGLNYGEIKESADIVTVSHDHADHANVAAIQGNPEVVNEVASVEIKGIKFSGISTYHDDAGGGKRGNNIIFCFEVDGVVVCHLGDLGHPLGDKEAAEAGKVDILLVPVGGNFTIGARVATDVCKLLAPRVVIPMHYQNERCPDFQVAGVDEFLEGKEGVSRLDASEAEFKQGELPVTCQVLVLKPAL
jgi:L-ascorbate metabolism protein UlaG (beta-lactamase superfamily)